MAELYSIGLCDLKRIQGRGEVLARLRGSQCFTQDCVLPREHVWSHQSGMVSFPLHLKYVAIAFVIHVHPRKEGTPG